MVERGKDFGLALKPREPVGISRDRRRQNLVATWRFRLVSAARYTSPIPPEPSGGPISYAPMRVPIWMGIEQLES